MQKFIYIFIFTATLLANNIVLRGANYIRYKARIARSEVIKLKNKRQVSVCFQSAIAALTISMPRIAPTRLQDIIKGEEIGKGMLHNAYLTEIEGEEFVFLKYGMTGYKRNANSLAFSDANNAFRDMTDSEKASLSQLHEMSDADKLQFIKDGKALFSELPLNHPKNQMAIIYLRELLDVSYMDRISSLTHNGERVFPQIRNLVFDENQILRGYVMNRVEGQSLQNVLKRGTMRPEIMRQIKEELLSQMKLLHDQNLIHGDLEYHLDNIIVKFDDVGNLEHVRMIDLNIALGLERSYTPNRERAFIDRHFRNAGLKD